MEIGVAGEIEKEIHLRSYYATKGLCIPCNEWLLDPNELEKLFIHLLDSQCKFGMTLYPVFFYEWA